jgi:hypothetical protein
MLPSIVVVTFLLVIGVPRLVLQQSNNKVGEDSLDPLPPWIDAEARLKALEAVGPTNKHEMRILAWNSIQTCGPYRQRQCDSSYDFLSWIRFVNAGGQPRWAIVWLSLHSFLNPERKIKSKWRVPEIIKKVYIDSDGPVDYNRPELQPDTLWRGIRVYNHAPTNEDIYALVKPPQLRRYSPRGFFVTSMTWNEDSNTYIFIDGAVRLRTWKRITGKPPTVFFPNGK